MRRIIITAVALSIAFFCGSAQATTIQTDGVPSHPYQAWVSASLVPTPNTTLTVSETTSGCIGTPSDTFACAVLSASTIDFLPYGPEPRLWFMHEVGHFFDHLVLTDQARSRFEAITGHTGPHWPIEDFANRYAGCAVHVPTKALGKRICRFLRH